MRQLLLQCCSAVTSVHVAEQYTYEYAQINTDARRLFTQELPRRLVDEDPAAVAREIEHHCNHNDGIADGTLFVVFFVAMLLVINRAFTIKDEVSFLTKKVWELLEGIMNVNQISLYTSFAILLITFSCLVMMTGFGYFIDSTGREQQYIRWVCHAVALPIVLVVLCDMALVGLQVTIDPTFDNFKPLIEFMQQKIPGFTPQEAKLTQAGIAIGKSVLSGGLGTSEGNGLKAGLALCAFLMNIALAASALSVDHKVAKWAFFGFAMVFFVPIAWSLLRLIPLMAKRVDPTLQPDVVTVLSKKAPSLIGAYVLLIELICWPTFGALVVQIYHYILTVGVPFYCVSSAAWWFLITDLMLYMVPLVLCLILWPAQIQALLTLGTQVVEKRLHKNAIAPTPLGGAPGQPSKNPQGGGEGGPARGPAADNLGTQPRLDWELALSTLPNQQYNVFAHGARSLLIGTRNNDILWNMLTHEHIGQNYIESLADGRTDIGVYYQATIEMLEVNGAY